MFWRKCFAHDCLLALLRRSASLKKKWGFRTILNLLLVVGIPFAVMTGCSMETYYPQKGADMRNEIIAYMKSVESGAIKSAIRTEFGHVDVTHIVEKYIKMSDSIETAKDILLKNGLDVGDTKNSKDVRRMTFRISATCLIEQGAYHQRSIMILIGKGPESENVDSVYALVDSVWL